MAGPAAGADGHSRAYRRDPTGRHAGCQLDWLHRHRDAIPEQSYSRHASDGSTNLIRNLRGDDDAAAREMVTATLEYCGAQVAAVASAVEARRRLPGTNWDLLLIDIAMPGEDGYTLIRDIRSTGLKQLAAALTAQARDIDRAQALAAGFDAHISKPVEARTLAHAVATLIGGARVTIT